MATLYGRMLEGDQIDWKWCFCSSCRMEWLVPSCDPDAYPKYCCHCREPIDLSVEPHDVCDDVDEESVSPVRYDVEVQSAQQYTVVEFGYDTTVRVNAMQEYRDIGDVEHVIVSEELCFLINDWLVVSMRMSHHSLAELAFFLEDYVSTCADMIAEGRSIVGQEQLRRFNGFTRLNETGDDT